jgi:hypothetical protein
MRAAAIALVLLAAACDPSGGFVDDFPGDDVVAFPPDATQLQPGEPIDLTLDDPAEDEDPFVMRTRDGTLVVVYFARVDGNADLYLTTSRDGAHWTSRVRVTTAPEDDFYPNLVQDTAGNFHLAWFRKDGPPTNYETVWVATTDDLTVWPTGEPLVTGGAIEDWVPTIAATPSGVKVVFSSKLRSADGRQHLYTKDGALPINATGEADHLAQMVWTGGQLLMVWVRCDDTDPTYCFSPSADLWTAASSDGVSWSTPVEITGNDGMTDALPGLYQQTDGFTWMTVWVTDAGVVDLPLGGSYPSQATVLPLDGYSPRVVATTTPGVYLGAWVAGSPQDVWVRVFQR